MRWLEEAINQWVFWVTNADKVKVNIERARVLVMEAKLDEAIALLAQLKKDHPSESSQALIRTFEQDLRDEKTTEVARLIHEDNYDQLLALFTSAEFYKKMPSLVDYINKHPVPMSKLS